MQGSIRDFSISNLENIPQNKTILMVCCKKTRKTKDTQLTKCNAQWGKGIHKCVGFIFFGILKNKLAYLWYTGVHHLSSPGS